MNCEIKKLYVYVCFKERQKQLESLGISLQSSGIKVGEDKSFLVNLNADPALNELLVYYLKVKTLFVNIFLFSGRGVYCPHLMISHGS